MEEILRQTLLYDFYGELLTEHQKQVYEDVVLNDYSLSEVAQSLSISRQGVHDMVKRSTRLLNEYEEKLHLVERFLEIRTKVQEIRSSTDCPDNIKRIADEILEESGVPRSERKKVIDKIAAGLILQSYLNSLETKK